MNRRIAGALVCAALLFMPSTGADATQPVPDGKGMATLAQALRRLPVVASLLHTGAHPDDENNALLAYASRGLHARTAYLSLNRGEGGQNLIGAELYDGIGIIRTEELLAARRFDGAEQYFTRAYDFGFSKSIDEALELWNEDDALLGDVVRVIRTFRPDVVVSVFAGSPADGHGQHQAAGLLTREAFRAAADPKRFPEQIAEGLRPWQPAKLYVTNTRASFPSLDSLLIPVGEYSPILDRSYRELGLAGRSMHRSQDMGALQVRGPAAVKIKLVDRALSRSGPTQDTDLFAGIDTSFLRLLAVAGPDVRKMPDFEPRLRRLDTLARQAIDAYNPFAPTSVLPPVLEAVQVLRDIRQDLMNSSLNASAKEDMRFLLDDKEQDFAEAIRLALGLSFEALADRERVVPGHPFRVYMELLNRSGTPVTPARLWLQVPDGGTVLSQSAALRPLGYNESVQDSLTVTLPTDARLTRPYWHRTSLNDARVTVDEDRLIGLPWQPPEVAGYARIAVQGVSIDMAQPVQYRYADPAFGEIRRALRVVPALSVTLSPEVVVVPADGRRHTRPLQVTVRSNVRGGASGTVRLTAPDGWHVVPEALPFAFSQENQEATLPFTLLSPDILQPGTHRIRAAAEYDGRTYAEGYREIAYPHIETRHLYRPAVSTVQAFDVRVADGLTVGYIMGVGDDVPGALEQLGVAVHLLKPDDLSAGDLHRYDVIIAGIRAYEVRQDLVSMNRRLLEYVKDGGTFIVQYNQYVFNTGSFGPYPARIRQPHDRVTREDAPVDLLVPDHPVFNTPNRITAEDFKGWVQERGLYFLGEWDERYTPLMSSHDPGEAPQAGGLVEARYGRGRYIYTGYAWFRQLPAGVPGAFRLFANLLSLPRTGPVP